jgi:hypothetical protein
MTRGAFASPLDHRFLVADEPTGTELENFPIHQATAERFCVGDIVCVVDEFHRHKVVRVVWQLPKRDQSMFDSSRLTRIVVANRLTD